MRPRRIPLGVKIQTKVGRLVAGIGVPVVKRNGSDLVSVWQHHDGPVQVQIKPLMIVVGEGALCRFIVHVPVNLALRTHDYGSEISHGFIVTSTECLISPEPLAVRASLRRYRVGDIA